MRLHFAWGPGKGRVGVGDITLKLNLLFFNEFSTLTHSVSLRELSQYHWDKHCSRSEIGGISAVLPAPVMHKKTGFPRL